MVQNGITENKNEVALYRHAPKFVPAGQSTQMIIGATPENDYQIVSIAENLYQKFDLKRVFYSAFVNVTHNSNLPALPGGPPLLREHRLYQADWLLRYYKFKVDELLSPERPDFNIFLDPKCDWADVYKRQARNYPAGRIPDKYQRGSIFPESLIPRHRIRRSIFRLVCFHR